MGTDDWSGYRLWRWWLYSAWKGPAHGVIGLILDGYIAKVGFRVRKSDEMIIRRPRLEPSIFDVDALPAVLLHLPSSAISAIENPGDLVLLWLGWVPQELAPAMLAEQAIELATLTCHLDDNHVSCTGLVEERVKVTGFDTTCDPTRKVLSVLEQFHITVAIEDVRVDNGEVSRFVVCGWRGRNTLWHGGKKERRYRVIQKLIE